MIIFLDIDGVLNQLQPNYYIDKNCVKNLATLCGRLSANIVLTSSWRMGYLHNKDKCSTQIKMLLNIFEEYNINVVGRTSNLGDRYREIQDYIKRYNVSKYIILDDDKSEFSIIDKHLYLVDYRYGLTKKDIQNRRLVSCI